jgi:hypothetical protein
MRGAELSGQPDRDGGAEGGPDGELRALDWQRRGGSRVVLEYNRARWSGPGAARSGAVVDRGLASVGSSYGKVDAGVARWVQFLRGD